MLKYEEQSGFSPQGALHLVNTSATPLPPVNQPYQFSDALKIPTTNQTTQIDPRTLLAIMTQTRHKCRSDGLIPRDITELIHIGKTLGLAPIHTRKIITHVQAAPDDSYSDLRTQSFSHIPIGTPHKKTRMPLRVLIGLSIWAITIAVAMQMV